MNFNHSTLSSGAKKSRVILGIVVYACAKNMEQLKDKNDVENQTERNRTVLNSPAELVACTKGYCFEKVQGFVCQLWEAVDNGQGTSKKKA